MESSRVFYMEMEKMLALVMILAFTAGFIQSAQLPLAQNKALSFQEAFERDTARANFTRGAHSVQLPVAGDSSIYYVGLYSTVIQLGTPPRNFTVKVDTGTAVTWVGCTQGYKSHLGSLYRPTNSTTSKYIRCGHESCQHKLIAKKDCAGGDLCQYQLNYTNGFTTTGFYVQDKIHLKGSDPQDAADLEFGCTLKRYDALPTDGVLGLSPDTSSMVSQLRSQGSIPYTFCHCFNGNDKNGTGFLLFDNPNLSNASFTRLIPDRTQYTTKLVRVTMGQFSFEINSSVALSTKTECIFDAGMNTGFLIADVFDRLSEVMSMEFKEPANHSLVDGHLCFKNASRYMTSSPHISFIFKGGSSLKMGPQDYLFKTEFGSICLAFRRSEVTTILGDIALKDKIVVYDLKNQYIGWQDYNCSSPLKSGQAYYLSGRGWWFAGRLFLSLMIYWLKNV